MNDRRIERKKASVTCYALQCYQSGAIIIDCKGKGIMKNSVFTVKGGRLGKLSKNEEAMYKFLLENWDGYKVGDSLSQKQLKKDFAVWNEDNTVNVSTIINEKNCRKVCLMIAKDISNGALPNRITPKVTINQLHGNFAIDFIDGKNFELEYNSKELKSSEIRSTNALDFITNYLAKDKTRENINSDENKKAKIQSIIDTLELLK